MQLPKAIDPMNRKRKKKKNYEIGGIDRARENYNNNNPSDLAIWMMLPKKV
jgi:hypothetical protein